MANRVPGGTLLLAVPQMRDPNFMHTVVTLVEHGEEGAYGLVVNRRLEWTVGDLLSEHPLLGACPIPVHYGGPVGQNELQYLHRLGELLPGGVEFAPGLWLGGELEALARALDEGRAREDQVRFFLGHSGWGASQLDAELVSGSWVLAPSDLDLVFAAEEPEAVWRRALRSLGEQGEHLARQPPDVNWN